MQTRKVLMNVSLVYNKGAASCAKNGLSLHVRRFGVYHGNGSWRLKILGGSGALHRSRCIKMGCLHATDVHNMQSASNFVLNNAEASRSQSAPNKMLTRNETRR